MYVKSLYGIIEGQLLIEVGCIHLLLLYHSSHESLGSSNRSTSIGKAESAMIVYEQEYILDTYLLIHNHLSSLSDNVLK